MQETTSTRYRSAWTSYWSSGALTSLPQDFPANYDGAIADFWRSVGEGLNPGSRILDVCTGNGAVALLFAQQSRQRGADWQVEAVDAANIDTDRLATIWGERAQFLSDITFHSGQAFETFPVPERGYDLIVSQYGIEYCHWQAAADRVAELLAQHGRLAMVNHSPDSGMLETMRAERAHFRLLKESGAFALVGRWLTGSLSLSDLRDRLRKPEVMIRRGFQQTASPLLEQAWNTVAAVRHASASELAERRQSLGDWIEALQAGAERTANMLQVNEAIAARPDWIQVFIDAGLRLETDEPLHYNEHHQLGRGRVLVSD